VRHLPVARWGGRRPAFNEPLRRCALDRGRRVCVDQTLAGQPLSRQAFIVLASIIRVGSNPSRSTCLQDRPVPLEIACPAVEGEEQQPVGPPAPREGVAPLDLVASESVPPDEVVQCAGTGGGAHRRHQ